MKRWIVRCGKLGLGSSADKSFVLMFKTKEMAQAFAEEFGLSAIGPCEILECRDATESES